MRYIIGNCTEIQEGIRVLQEQASAPTARESDIAYCELITAITKGDGFNFMTTSKSYDLNKADLRELVKELLYAIETERVCDYHTHAAIVTETLENVVGYLA